jgi:hypothetical protein
MSGPAENDWASMCERWRVIALENYQPISESKCNELVKDTLEAVKTYELPEVTTDTSSFGWCDSIQLDDDNRFVRFVIRKTLPNADLKQVVDHSWSLYDDGDLYKKTHLADNCELFHQTLQRISPDAIIIQRVVRYPDLEQLTHSLVIVFRVQTETGYMIAIRCIDSPRLQNLMKADGLSLGGSW